MSQTVYSVLQAGPLVGFGVLLVRLYVTQLNKVYRYFSIYVLVEFVRQIVSMSVPHRSNLFAYAFMGGEIVAWTFSVLALLEVFGLVLRNHIGIQTAGRKALLWALALSVMLSLGTLLMDFQDSAVPYPILQNFYLLSRLVMVSLLLFILLPASLLLWFPIPLNRNTIYHCCIFAIYFLAKAAVFVAARVFTGEAVVYLNAVLFTVITICCGAWVTLLTRSGEVAQATLGHYWDRDQEDRLMAQLEAINRTLVHSAKD